MYLRCLRKNINNIINNDMAIQDEMYKAIEKEIAATIASGKEKVIVNESKAKEVAKMLTRLSVDNADAESLTNPFIAQIKVICQ